MFVFRNRACSASFNSHGETPSNTNCPVVGGSSNPSMYSSVLFPLPDGPMIDNASPSCKSMSTLSSTGTGPAADSYVFEIARACNMSLYANAANCAAAIACDE